jgi:glycosyltransferase involved in cell wall biosynthesis
MNNPLVSVIIPNYNHAKFLDERILSVLNQTYQNWELIITDDNSTDDTRLILQRYANEHKRIKFFFLYQNSGAGYCRNNSIKHARGRYIAFCDSDDCWIPEKLERQIRFMNDKKCCLCYSSYYTIDEKSIITGVVKVPEKLTFKQLKHDNKIGCLTAIYDTSRLGKFYMPPIRKRQDWAMFLNILKECQICFCLPEPLAYYRQRDNSVSSKKLSLVKYNVNVYETVFGYSTIKAYLYFFTHFIPTYFIKVWKRKRDSLRYLSSIQGRDIQ